ncbi:MAG: hypothetical protein V1773_16625 [bacterium]
MEEEKVHEDILFIRKIIEDNRRKLVDNGLSYIINGSVLAIGIPITVTMGFVGMETYIPYVWLFLVAVMIALNITISKRVQKNFSVKTFGSEVFNALWLACGISIMIIFILSITTSAITPSAFITSCASIFGIGYLLTGVINDLKFMKILAAFWWLTAIITGLWGLFAQLNYMPIFFSAMVLILQLIPAAIIYKKWKKAYNEHSI